jgi:hypothetical protein
VQIQLLGRGLVLCDMDEATEMMAEARETNDMVMRNDEEPRFLTELWQIALIFLKVAGGTAVVGGFIFGLAQFLPPVYVMAILYAMILLLFMVWMAHSTYQSKLKDYRRGKEIEARNREWEEARNRAREKGA